MRRLAYILTRDDTGETILTTPSLRYAALGAGILVRVAIQARISLSDGRAVRLYRPENSTRTTYQYDIPCSCGGWMWPASPRCKRCYGDSLKPKP